MRRDTLLPMPPVAVDVDLNALSLSRLFELLMDEHAIAHLLDAAIEEDLGGVGDVTTESIIDPSRQARAEIVARTPGVIAGLPLVHHALTRFGMRENAFSSSKSDGTRCSDGQTIGVIKAPLAKILAAERTILNLLGHMSGVASMSRRFVDAAAELDVEICETRKTTPGLRHLQKYAVRCGGATLHRIGLYDAALYKDNHLAHIRTEELAARLTEAIRRLRANHRVRFVEVEVDTLEQFEQVLSMERGLVDYVLLDNMPTDQMRDAVALRNEHGSAIRLEASGRITIERLREVAETGVERISIGAMTHSAPVLDLGLDIRETAA
jgi:nicotinate-nucleotide pyrophosphorylase (carboxylating)